MDDAAWHICPIRHVRTLRQGRQAPHRRQASNFSSLFPLSATRCHSSRRVDARGFHPPIGALAETSPRSWVSWRHDPSIHHESVSVDSGLPFVAFLIGLAAPVLPYIAPQIGSSWQRHSSHSQADKPFLNTLSALQWHEWLEWIPSPARVDWRALGTSILWSSTAFDPVPTGCSPDLAIPPAGLSIADKAAQKNQFTLATNKPRWGGRTATAALLAKLSTAAAALPLHIQTYLHISCGRPGQQPSLLRRSSLRHLAGCYTATSDLRPSILPRRDPMRGRSLLSPSLSAVQASVCLL